ncbi:MAG: hypothetical protein ABH952_07950 [Candidatus Omnitrophota bacterium]
MRSPKIIVVAGAHSNIGKTTLAGQLSALLDKAVRVKIGHHPMKEHGDKNYYYAGTTFSEILADNQGCRFLIIESNQILKQIKPDCLIFLTGPGKTKPSAEAALIAADIIRGMYLDTVQQRRIAAVLGINMAAVRKIIELSGAYLQK